MLRLLLLACLGATVLAGESFPSKRPAPELRRFTSAAVENTIATVSAAMADRELAWMFANCFPNTLDTTVTLREEDGRPYTYVITGDIHAMWLRDSSAQVWPYLPLAKDDAPLRRLLAGVVNQQTVCVLRDPYANAFYADPKKPGEFRGDHTQMKPGVHERKWEIDSLCYVIRLAHGYWQATGDTAPFDARWAEAMRLIVKTFRDQQRLKGPGPYRHQRTTRTPTDTQFGQGFGNPTKKVGLIYSMYRPSDDATYFPFLIPSNYFAMTELRLLATMAEQILPDAALAQDARALADQLDAALKQHAVAAHPTAGRIIALECDGFGNHLFMDDANVPNVLSLAYLGAIGVEDPLYRASRAFSLSEQNPWYARGKVAAGIGGPHIGERKIWPMGIVMQALTSRDDAEIRQCLAWLKASHAGTGFMHESFDVDNAKQFTRAWFAWANTLFGELIVTLHRERPQLLAQPLP
jgi:hypothetical protein